MIVTACISLKQSKCQHGARGRGGKDVPGLAKELASCSSFWGEEKSVFFKVLTLDRLIIFQGGLIPKSIRVTQVRLNGLENKSRKHEDG